jgi:hypothetical protein
VNVSDEQREQLQAIVRKHISAQQLVPRARTVLLGAGEGQCALDNLCAGFTRIAAIVTVGQA